MSKSPPVQSSSSSSLSQSLPVAHKLYSSSVHTLRQRLSLPSYNFVATTDCKHGKPARLAPLSLPPDPPKRRNTSVGSGNSKSFLGVVRSNSTDSSCLASRMLQHRRAVSSERTHLSKSSGSTTLSPKVCRGIQGLIDIFAGFEKFKFHVIISCS